MPPRTQRTSIKPVSIINLVSIAFLNLKLHRLRTVVNMAGISVSVAAVAFFLSFYRGTYEGVMFASVIDYAMSQGQFNAATFDDDDPDSWLDVENLIPLSSVGPSSLFSSSFIATAGNDAVTAPRLMSPAYAGNGLAKAPVILAGVDFRKEAAVFSIDKRMIQGSFAGESGVVIGKKLAESLGVAVGDEIRIQANAVDSAPNLDYWKVGGIYSTGYPPVDRGYVFARLDEVGSFLSAGESVNKIYSRVELSPGSAKREAKTRVMRSAAPSLGGLGLEFREWKQYAKAIVADVEFDNGFFAIFIFILLFLSFSTVGGTMRVSVYERKREIGMLRACGWYRSEIGKQFIIESILIGAAGSLVGCILGGIFAVLLEYHPYEFAGVMTNLDIPEFKLTCQLESIDLFLAFLSGFLTAFFAGITPAISAAKMPVLSALSDRQ